MAAGPWEDYGGSAVAEAPPWEDYQQKEPTAPPWEDYQTQGAGGAAFSAVGQGIVKSLGSILRGVAMQSELHPPSDPEFYVPGRVDVLDKAWDDYMEKVKDPVRLHKAIVDNPSYQLGKNLTDVAEETYPIESKQADKILTKTAGMVGDFLPMMATGPGAPVAMMLQSEGDHLEADYEAAKASGQDEPTAAKAAIDKAMLSGVAQGTIFAALPAPLRSLGEKYLIDKFGTAIGKVVAGRAVAGIEGTVTGTTSRAAEDAVEGKLPGADALESGLGLGALNVVLPPYGLKAARYAQRSTELGEWNKWLQTPEAKDILNPGQSPTGRIPIVDGGTEPPPAAAPAAQPNEPPPAAPPFAAPVVAPLFQSDASIPFMAKIRMEDEMRAAGHTDEAIAKLTTPEASAILDTIRKQRDEAAAAADANGPQNIVDFSPAPEEPLAEPAPPTDRAPRELSEEDLTRQQYEDEMRQSLEDAGAENGPELMETLIKLGGLPHKENASRSTWQGELDTIEESLREPKRLDKISPTRIFKKQGTLTADDLTQQMQGYGFDVKTPDDLTALLEERIRTGRKIYGNPELTNSEDYTGMGRSVMEEPAPRSAEEASLGYDLQELKRSQQAIDEAAFRGIPRQPHVRALWDKRNLILRQIRNLDEVEHGRGGRSIRWEDDPESAAARALIDKPQLSWGQAVVEGGKQRAADIEQRIYDREPIPRDALKSLGLPEPEGYVARGEAGMLFPAERLDQFVDRNQIPEDKKEDAKDGIARTLSLAADPQLAFDYESNAEELRNRGRSRVAEKSPKDPLQDKRTKLHRQAAASRRGLEALKKGDAAALSAALKENQNRISTIIPELIKGFRAHWRIAGTYLKSPVDMMMAVQTLRSPYVEMLKVAVLDRNDKVLDSDVVSVGTLNESIAHPRDIFRLAVLWDAKKIIISHNHPSGDASPSQTDHSLHHRLTEVGELLGIDVVDHVITNGKQYYSFREARLDELPEPKLAPWELVRNEEMPKIDAPEKLKDYLATLRSTDPNSAHVFYLSTRYNLKAIHRIPDATANLGKLRAQVMAGASREGAYAVILDLPGGSEGVSQHRAMRSVADALDVYQVKLLDATWPGMESALQAGLISEAVPGTYGNPPADRVREESAPRPWQSDFPDVQIHTNVSALRRHPEFKAAKAGDEMAAAKVVRDLIKPDRIRAIVQRNPDAIVVYPHAEEATGKNKLPVALASVLESAGLEVEPNIIQTNKVKHTDASAIERLLRTPEFSGPIQKGRKYIVVDDVTTSGSTLSGLRHYIEARDGQVAEVMTLATTSSPTTGYGGHLAPRPSILDALRSKFDENQLNRILQDYGIAESIGHLTNSQARYIASYRTLDGLRAGITEAGFRPGAPKTTEALPRQSDLRADSKKALTNLRREPLPGGNQMRLLEEPPEGLYRVQGLNRSARAHRGGSPTPPASPAPNPAVAKAVAPVASWWQQRTLGIRKVFAPQTIDLPARMVANIIRDYNGQLANTIAMADHALAAARRDFDRTPVPRSWKYDPNQPLPRNYAFIDNSERGGAGLSPADQKLKAQLDQMFSDAVDEVHRVAPKRLQSLIQDYFPHIWEDPEEAKRVFAEIVSKRPLEGPKGFLKQRVLEYTIDGLKAGLRPASDNPIDMSLTKLHEVHRFVAAQDMIRETKAIGARKFVYIFERPPEGWIKLDDPTTAVHVPPFVTIEEAFDQQMKGKIIQLLDDLGIVHQRRVKLPGGNWGDYTPAMDRIRAKFGGPLSVYFHELGHGLEARYGWLDQIAPLKPVQKGHQGIVVERQRLNLGGKSEIEKQLRALADLRFEGLQTTTPGFKRYVRTRDEKSAVILEAYIHAPEKMRDVAPNIYGRVKKFIAAHPELRPLEDIRPSLVMGQAKGQIDVGGMVTLGNYYMPAGAAQVFTNYLSPGLMRFGVIRSIRQSTNILSGLQLGFSAFHAGFTSIDAAVSQFALGLRYLTEGHPLRALEKVVTTPAAPLTNYLLGRKVQRAMLEPGYGSQDVQRIAQLAVRAGLRATVDPFWRTQITRNMIRAFHEGGVKGYAGTAVRLPFAISEQLMRPILEVLVPRQKLGVFAGMAEQHMLRLGPHADIHQVRDAMARAADATEDRMGQMTYDNLFYNRIARDAALLGFRAYGWTYGKYRALFGGVSDVFQTPGRIRAGGPIFSDRMAYLIALPMVAASIGSLMNYWMTGEAPKDWRDTLMPRTGRFDRHGNPQRLSLPTYVKDLLSDWHDFPDAKKMLLSFYHKLNPGLSIAVDTLNNADFYATRIYNPDDPFMKRQLDKFVFAMKSATPFSITGANRLAESDPSMAQQVLPFFGFVPAKTGLTMTPAQARAAELMYDTLPRGSRTPDQAEHAKFVSTLIRDMREADPNWQAQLSGGIASGQIRPDQIGQLFKGMPLSPMQYQVKKLTAEKGMKVWDLANAAEREQLRAILLVKVTSSKTITQEQRVQWLQLLAGASQK